MRFILDILKIHYNKNALVKKMFYKNLLNKYRIQKTKYIIFLFIKIKIILLSNG
jgi:hypothetical protein